MKLKSFPFKSELITVCKTDLWWFAHFGSKDSLQDVLQQEIFIQYMQANILYIKILVSSNFLKW